ncbi:MAG: DUF1549 domain-containing protein [Verrucomicrobiales bacterium]
MRIITPTILACAVLNTVVISAPSGELISEATARINAAVDAGLGRAKATYNVGLNDHLFVRRVYTDLAGRIPTHDEVQSFVKSMKADKRDALIDRLLASDDFVSHNYNWIADLLRIQSQVPGTKLRTDAFSFWLKQQLKSNRPFDRIVHEMVTAKGRIWDNPATGYHLRDNGMKLDHVSYMTKAFLGTDISCAQCHDAPFHDWTQFEYYELTSFLAKMDTRENLQKRPAKPRKGKGKTAPAKKNPKSLYINRNQAREHLAKKHKIDTSNEKGQQQLRRLANRFNRAYREIVAANELVVHSNPKAVLKLPDTYEYDDAKPGQVVKPRAIFGNEPKSRTTSDRMRFANWLVSRNNPRFSINLGNRLWQRYLGRGAAEPLHDMPEPEYWDNPELVRTLQGTVLALNYDLRAITKAIVSSKAYLALASTNTVKLNEPYFFPGPVLRRMKAEQIWDSLLTLMVEDPFAYRRTSGKSYNDIINMMDTGVVPIPEFIRITERYNAYRPDSELIDRNGKPVNAKINFQRRKGGEEMMMMRDARKNRMVLARASELTQPAPQGHFLRDFGQSSRNFLVDAATLEGSVPQVMELMNGAATQILANRNSLIFQKMKAEKTPLKRAEIVFLSILSRKMTPKEQAMMVHEIKRGDAALTDLIWALLNTPEFLFIK